MILKIKKLREDAQLPRYGRPGDAGIDICCTEDYVLKAGERKLFMVGFALELDPGYVFLIWDRSGMAAKYGIKTMGGVVDYTYRGELGVTLLNTSNQDYAIKKGDRIAQALIQPIMTVEIEEVDVLGETVRGDGAFGSSGKN